jgi:hypothetical protein
MGAKFAVPKGTLCWESFVRMSDVRIATTSCSVACTLTMPICARNFGMRKAMGKTRKECLPES